MLVCQKKVLIHQLLWLSGSALKVLAVLSMVVDHCAYYFLESGTLVYWAMRCFGRVAFPVFALLVAEGYAHTRDRVRYFLTLLGFAVVSEVPWQLLGGADGTHNVMFTLSLGVAAMAAFEWMRERRALAIASVLLAALSAEVSGFGLWVAWHCRDTHVPPVREQKIQPKHKAVATRFHLSAHGALWHHRNIAGLLRNFTL